jgi:hypothetical protein
MQSAANLPATLWTGLERGVGSGRGVERGSAADTVPATFEKIVGNLDRLHPITPVDRH